MRVAMMLYAGFRLLEVSGPMDVFHEANRLYGAKFYEPHLIGPSPGPVVSSNGTAVNTTACLFETHRPFDIVVVPGSPVAGSARERHDLVDWLSDAGRRSGKLACISSGAFLLARAGLAEHRWLATHWRDTQRLAAEYPGIHVIDHPGCLKDGNLYSSGGAGAGVHLALALVREDLGEDAEGLIARNVIGAATLHRARPTS
jgi:transcriptional regulator GlxA family with amidase domain